MDSGNYEAELERRLTIIEDPAYDDPARGNLPRLDLIVLLIATAVVVTAMWVWGAPA